MFTRAIVRPPAPNFAEGLTTAGLGPPDYQLALRQHAAYCAALEQCGLTLIRLEPDPNYRDSCFVEDTAVFFGAANDLARPLSRRVAVLTRPGASARSGEVESIRPILAATLTASKTYQIDAPGTLDGGDVCEAGDHFFIGVSERTNVSGARQLAEFVAARGYTFSLVDIRLPVRPAPRPVGIPTQLLHLKSGVAYLGNHHLVVTESLAAREEFAGFELVPVRAGEEYAANCVRVNDYVLIAAGHDHFGQTLRELGYRTIALEMSEFQKMDGGLSCLSLRW